MLYYIKISKFDWLQLEGETDDWSPDLKIYMSFPLFSANGWICVRISQMSQLSSQLIFVHPNPIFTSKLYSFGYHSRGHTMCNIWYPNNHESEDHFIFGTSHSKSTGGDFPISLYYNSMYDLLGMIWQSEFSFLLYKISVSFQSVLND